jgi:peptidoglycan hydrolase-like protein with peptidoglycan-binding domain
MPRDRRADDDSVPAGGLPHRLFDLVVTHPATSGGVLLSVVTVGLVVVNALVHQPAPHPHPFFTTRAADAPRAAVPIPIPAPTPAQVPSVLPRPRPTAALDPAALQELQSALRDRGFYTGPLDGVLGPATSDAIRAFEKRLGATPTGEPSDLLIAAVRATPTLQTGSIPTGASTAPGAAQPVAIQPPAPIRTAAVPPAPAPVPAPAARFPAADAVAWPAGSDPSVVEIAAPVAAATIRRAQREPLAKGGDERLQKIQRALVAAGYGPVRADGRWDDHSIAAVKRYEADRGWPVSGKPSDRLVYDLMAGGPNQARR